MDSHAFLTKWLQDLRDTQNADGAFPGVAPVIPGRFDGGYGRAGWADAGVHVPVRALAGATATPRSSATATTR